MTRILIVDDHPLVRTGFAQLIGDCPDLEVCGEAGDMAEALKQIDATGPDLAIIDLSLAGGSGLDLIEHIKGRVAGSTWSDAGGPGAIYFDEASKHLIVLQSQPVQVAVERLLAQKPANGN